MNGSKKIQSALISVYHKDNLENLVRKLNDLGVTLYATGGTFDFIRDLGIGVTAVEDITEYPSILGGRVKTLHPKIFGGILSRREEKGDVAELDRFNIPSIDLVIVDLYPFETAVAAGAGQKEIIEKIDIGGISLIRAAAKNFHDVLIIPSVAQYGFLDAILSEKQGATTIDDRRKMAAFAFHISSHYDSAIFNYFNKSDVTALKISEPVVKMLRYGENPHQQGMFFGNLDAAFEQLSGKEISYNNILDLDAAAGLLAEFDEPTAIVVKHNNACGLASSEKLSDAWKYALAGDPVSAFGGVIALNREPDRQTAAEIDKLFFEIIVAPSYPGPVIELLSRKKNRIILKQKETNFPVLQVRSALNGYLCQDRDIKTEHESDMRPVTTSVPSNEQLADLVFANKIVKHTKSNTIVLAKDKKLLASGTGQTSRVDALVQAIDKAKKFGFDLNGAVMASDAFFPFPDCVEIAGKAGITAIVQPGGSVKDQESIDYCNRAGLVMVMTGARHFRH